MSTQRSGGTKDPLLAYDEQFDAIDDPQPDAFRRLGDRVALRFLDPEQRTDAAGRAIPHEFVLNGPEAEGLSSLDKGRAKIWPVVAEEYGEAWGATEGPAVQE